MKAPFFLRAVLACAGLLAALPLTPQTLLLVVRENANAHPLPPPFAVREGISGSLFDAGFIVIDAPGSAPVPSPVELARLARSAGADMVLEVAAEYADKNLGPDLVRISARTSFALIDSSTGGIVTQGTQEATNKDRERDVSRAVLGSEIGREVARRVRKALDRR
jgi:hypothetical protein